MCTFAVKFVLQLPIYNFLEHTAVVETSINKIGLLWNTNVFLRKEMYFWVKKSIVLFVTLFYFTMPNNIAYNF